MHIYMHIKLVDKLISIQNISIVTIKILIQVYVYLLDDLFESQSSVQEISPNTIRYCLLPSVNLYYPSLWVSDVVKCKQNSPYLFLIPLRILSKIFLKFFDSLLWMYRNICCVSFRTCLVSSLYWEGGLKYLLCHIAVRDHMKTELWDSS